MEPLYYYDIVLEHYQGNPILSEADWISDFFNAAVSVSASLNHYLHVGMG